MHQAPARERPVTHNVPDRVPAGPGRPPILRPIEYGYHAVLGDARAESAPLVYVLITVLALRHYDTADHAERFRSRTRRRPPTLACRPAAGASPHGRGTLAGAA